MFISATAIMLYKFLGGHMMYDNETLRAVNQTWKNFKTKTGSSQAKAAKAMGMNQSSVSQYLRGEIPLNTDFLTKFSKLTGTELIDAGANAILGAQQICVRYTLSGKELKETVALIPSPVPLEHCYAVVVDYCDFAMQQGTLILVDPTATIKEFDPVIFVSDLKRLVYGFMSFSEGEWEVLEPHYKGGNRYPVKNTDAVHRAGGTFVPEKVGKTFRH